MIISRLIGGFGNQLFQYALGRHLAHIHNVEFKIDISPFETYKLHDYSLNHFNIRAGIATKEDVEQLRYSSFRNTLEKLLPYYRRSIVHQRGRRFDSNILKYTRNAYLIGYWQSEKYFVDIESAIRSEFTLAQKHNDGLKNAHALIEQMRSANSVMVHVRRGDFVSNPKTNYKHGTCSPEYYARALKYTCSNVNNPNFFVFSDDIEWAKNNLQFGGYSATFVDHGVKQNYLDLTLMSACKHSIIANSSFSWWGAWLGENTESVIVAPKRWLANSSKDLDDLVPSRWTRL